MAKETIKGYPLELQDLKELLNSKYELIEQMEAKWRAVLKLKSERLKISHKVAEIEKKIKEKCRQ